jgi:hypothetical protein
MRLQILLIAATTLLLAGCGGKSVNNKAGAAPTDSGKTAATADSLAGHFDYAIFNKDGSEFLIITDNEDYMKGGVDVNGVKYKKLDKNTASTYTIAYSAARKFDIKFVGMQTAKRKPKEDEPPFSFNMSYFADLSGYLYENLGGTANGDEMAGNLRGDNVLLCDADFAKNYPLVSNFAFVDGGKDAEVAAAMQKKYNRKVIDSRTLVTFGNGCKVVALQFENKGENALAAYVLKSESGYSVYEITGIYDGENTWAEADDGKFDFTNHIDCVFKGAGGYLMFVIEPMGENGNDVYMLRQHGDKLVKEDDCEFTAIPTGEDE